MISPQVSNIAIMLLMMQASRRIDMENEQNIMYIRAAYIISIVSTYLVYQFVKRRIVATNDTTTITVTQPKNPMKPQETPVTEVMSVRDYDLREVDTAIKSIWSGVAMMAFMHLYMKYTNPLFMQCINPIKGALEHNETKIHLFGHKAEGELKRPFKAAPGLLEGLMGGASASQPAAAAAAPVAESASATATGASARIEELD